jgi:hypothetical protein
MTPEERSKLFAKVRIVFAACALPGGLIATVGDFFSPAGGWVLPMASGALGLFVLAVLVVCSELRNHARRVLDGLPETEGYFRGPVTHQAGLWCLLVFGVTGLVVGGWSHGHRKEGGVLAEGFPSIRDAQSMVPLLRESLAIQKRVADSVDAMARNVKKETSEEPQKELQNRGVSWRAANMLEAVRNGEIATVSLFVQGGMRAPEGTLYVALRRFDVGVAKALTAQAHTIQPDDCTGFHAYEQSLVDSAEKMRFVATVCRQEGVEARLRTALADASESVSQLERANETVGSDRAACMKRMRREWPPERLATVPLLSDINGNHTTGDIPEERVAMEYNRALFEPASPGARLSLDEVYQSAVTAGCNASYAVRPVSHERRDFLKRLLAEF